MNELQPGSKELLINLKNNNQLPSELRNPFLREIFLFDTYIAGTTHVENIETICDELVLKDKVSFYRQINNTYDNNAIEVRDTKDRMIGFIPKQDNVIFARLMDAGKLLYGRVVNKEVVGKWVKISIAIFLQD